jgi:hypothetical protein
LLVRCGRSLAALAVMLVLVLTARPPYGALALLPLGLTEIRLRTRIVAAGSIVACLLLWTALVAATSLNSYGVYLGADPAAQLARLGADPWLLVTASWNAIAQFWPRYLEGFIGRLGTDTVPLPPAYHSAAWAMLGIAAVAAMLGLRGDRINDISRPVVAALVLGSVVGLFATEYLIWTVPGGAVVDGIQGRYFLPLVLVAAPLLPALGTARWSSLRGALTLVVAAFPVVSLTVSMNAVIQRFYLG